MSALTVAEVLDGAADLLTPEGAWTQGAQAKDADGFYVERTDNTAVCWCTVGAVGRVADLSDTRLRTISQALRAVSTVTGGKEVSRWNDAYDRTQAEVVGKLREAAALAREQQA